MIDRIYFVLYCPVKAVYADRLDQHGSDPYRLTDKPPVEQCFGPCGRLISLDVLSRLCLCVISISVIAFPIPLLDSPIFSI